MNLGKVRADENALSSLGGARRFGGAPSPPTRSRWQCHAFGESLRARRGGGRGLLLHALPLRVWPRTCTCPGSTRTRSAGSPSSARGRMATFDDMAIEQKLTVYDKGVDQPYKKLRRVHRTLGRHLGALACPTTSHCGSSARTSSSAWGERREAALRRRERAAAWVVEGLQTRERGPGANKSGGGGGGGKNPDSSLKRKKNLRGNIRAPKKKKKKNRRGASRSTRARRGRRSGPASGQRRKWRRARARFARGARARSPRPRSRPPALPSRASAWARTPAKQGLEVAGARSRARSGRPRERARRRLTACRISVRPVRHQRARHPPGAGPGERCASAPRGGRSAVGPSDTPPSCAAEVHAEKGQRRGRAPGRSAPRTSPALRAQLQVASRGRARSGVGPARPRAPPACPAAPPAQNTAKRGMGSRRWAWPDASRSPLASIRAPRIR